ncbi:MAG: potassium/proton antiporter [Anaerolineae bacterium]|nr:potassium/proton antiporter [Anaerolineae bacterium]
MPALEVLLIITAGLLFVSIVLSKVAVKAGVPVLLLFLGLGMLLGSDGPGRIYFDYPWLAQSVGVIALVFILFSGGLDTQWTEIRPVLRQGLLLSTAGVLLTALLVGALLHLVFDFSLVEGILVGAIISSTDAAAVFSVLRGKSITLKGSLRPLLEFESGSNDPVAVFLTISMIQLVIAPDSSPVALIPAFVLQMSIGLLVGVLGAELAIRLINRVRLEYDGLYSALTIALVLLIYGGAALLGGNGFLAVYLAGVLMARQDFIHKRSLSSFHDGLAWLMQILMFLTLGLQVYPSRLSQVAGTGLLVALFLMFIARPLSVFAALFFEQLRLREKVFIAWVGLRGAAPIVLATFPLVAGLTQSGMIFDLVFFIVLASALLQGSLISPVARLLRVFEDNPQPIRSPLSFVMQDDQISDNLIECSVASHSPLCGKQILDLNLPPNTLIIMIGRGNDLIVPRGDTIIEAGDRVLFLARPEVSLKIRTMLEQQSM